MTLTLAAAQTIANVALAEARTRSAKPLALIVLDAGGHPVLFAREDGATTFRLDIAKAKATGALGMGVNTRATAERAQANPLFYQSVTAVLEGRIAFSPGGVLIHHDGAVIGAVGVSGDTGDCDEECAMAGIRAAGFATETN